MIGARPAPVLLACALLAAPADAQPAASPAARGADGSDTPREAVVGVLDKRLGRTEFFTLKPGDRFRFGTLEGILRTCEQTLPWERPKRSGAFVQVTETPRAVSRRAREAPERKLVFSGWLFAESPSLNPLRHPVYDVWLKSCTMRFPGTPPPATAASAQRRRSAPAPAPPAPEPVQVPAPAPPSGA
jgi:hypothetical protein